MSDVTQKDFERSMIRALDDCLDAGVLLDFWWRDDDATEPTAALDELIAAATGSGAPLLLAVIPEPAIPSLFSRIADIDEITISQHGFAHVNHETRPAKAAELGNARAEEAVLSELSTGKLKLQHYGGDQFAPILTPPWNRISPEIAERRFEIGLPGLSTFGSAPDDPHQVNTHLDVIAWRGDRGFIGWGKTMRIVEEEIETRRNGNGQPFGLLTHHLVHDDGVRTFLDSFFSIARNHGAVRWPDHRSLFSL